MICIVYVSGIDRLDEEVKAMAKKKFVLTSAIRATCGVTVLEKVPVRLLTLDLF